MTTAFNRVKRCAALLLALLLPAWPEETAPSQVLQKETLQYGIEWRLIRAGNAKITWMPLANSFQGNLDIASTGLVSKLYRVYDRYSVQMEDALCARTIYLRAQEGKRNRETKVAFDRSAGKISYSEKDLNKNEIVLTKELEAQGCVFDYLGGLFKLRGSKIELGQSTTVPMSDGKKFAAVKVEAQEREQVKTPSGTYSAIRYEVHMMNNVLVSRGGRVYVWVSDDDRRLPVQIRVKLSVLIGTITLQLEKIERGA